MLLYYARLFCAIMISSTTVIDNEFRARYGLNQQVKIPVRVPPTDPHFANYLTKMRQRHQQISQETDALRFAEEITITQLQEKGKISKTSSVTVDDDTIAHVLGLMEMEPAMQYFQRCPPCTCPAAMDDVLEAAQELTGEESEEDIPEPPPLKRQNATAGFKRASQHPDFTDKDFMDM